MAPNSKISIADLPGDPADRTIIVGAGIVGSAIAKHLSSGYRDSPSKTIIVLDTSISPLQGSTGHAPGFVGQLNELPVLTALARASVNEYLNLAPGAFFVSGGLEIASSPEGLETLHRRLKLAREAGISARMISAAEITSLVPQFYQNGEPTSTRALHFPDDGTADPEAIVSEYRMEATTQGVLFLDAEVHALLQDCTASGRSRMSGVDTSLGIIEAKQATLATGIWTAQLLQSAALPLLPIIPVGHPYIYGPERTRRSAKTPFVRWPEKHVYARDHGTFDGFGTYDHAPLAFEKTSSTAIEKWNPIFNQAIGNASKLFPEEFMTAKDMRPFNGVFAVTPDGLPLIGPLHDLDGLWIAAAIWVTSAAGAAKVLADMIQGKPQDVELCKSLDPNRFTGQDVAKLRAKALSTYNDIYNKRPT